MDVAGWEQRYRLREKISDFETAPTPLLTEIAANLDPGDALDLACGTGRNALWLSSHGWRVTAVDGSQAAIESLLARAHNERLRMDARVVDLARTRMQIPPHSFDLVLFSYYLQRDLFTSAKAGLKPGGVLLVIAHTTEGNELPTETRLSPGELRSFFEDWNILHLYEGSSRDPAHKRSVAEIVARKPVSTKF